MNRAGKRMAQQNEVSQAFTFTLGNIPQKGGV